VSDVELARLRWRCRRGLLELDLLLQRFVDACYAGLTTTERLTFDRLLTLPDADLLVLLQGDGAASDAELNRLVTAIRRHAQHRA